MPKRIVDGDGLWRSDKLGLVQPSNFRAEYANLLPLALANGVFEANARRIWATVYSYNRSDVTVGHVEQILAEFERVRLLLRWEDTSTCKQWGYFVGIEKPGRLPAPSRLRHGHEVLGPEPPKELLGNLNVEPETNGQPTASQPLPNGSRGFGFCLGLGSGKDNAQPTASQETQESQNIDKRPSEFNPTEVAQILCQQNGWSGRWMIVALEAAIEFQAKRMPESSLEQVGEWLVKAFRDQQTNGGKYGPQKFFEQGMYAQAALSHETPTNVLLDNPATRALAQMEGD